MRLKLATPPYVRPTSFTHSEPSRTLLGCSLLTSRGRKRQSRSQKLIGWTPMEGLLMLNPRYSATFATLCTSSPFPGAVVSMYTYQKTDTYLEILLQSSCVLRVIAARVISMKARQ